MTSFPAGANCDVCPLYNPYLPPVLMEMPVEGRADVIFVSKAPGAEEVAKRRPFVGASGELLRASITAANPDNQIKVAYTNVCCCRARGNDDPPAQAVEACAGRLQEEIKRSGARLIVALGNTALRSFGVSDSSTKAAGKQYDTLYGRVAASVDPAFVYRTPTQAKSFRIIIQRIMQDAGPQGRQTTVPTEVPYTLVRGPDDLPHLTGEIVLDIETATPNKTQPNLTNRIRCVALCDGQQVWIVPENQVYTPWFVARLKKFFANPENVFIGHNVKFDAKFLIKLCDQLPTQVADTMLMHYSVNEEGMAASGGDVKDGKSRGHGLKLLTELLFGVEDYGLHGDYDTVAEDTLYKYAAKDGLYTFELYKTVKRSVDANSHTHRLCHELLFPASIALAHIEIGGIKFDAGFCDEAIEELTRCQNDIVRELRDIAGSSEYKPGSVNWNRRIIYDDMRLPPHHNERGNLTTDAPTVAALLDHLILGDEAPDSPRVLFLDKLIEFRAIQKTITTYIVGMQKHNLDGRVFPSFNLHTVVTGRLSSSDPNAQNITRSGVIRRDQSRLSDEFIRRHFPGIAASWATNKPMAPNYGKVIRQQFAPDEGQIILQADYSQAELRVLCWAARDENMREAYAQGQDLHTITAAAVFGSLFTALDLSSDSQATLWKELRTMAKTVNFGIPYGRGATAIAQAIWRQMKIEEKRKKTFKQVEEEAHKFVAEWFALRPNVKLWQEATVNQAMRGEPIYTPFGRRRLLSVIPNRKSREFVDVKNHVMNFPIQSIASDCTLMSLIRIHAWMRNNGWWNIHGRIIATVHDSIVFSVKQQYAKQLAEVVQGIMIQVPLEYLGDYVPFEVDFEHGTRWGNLEKFTA